MTIEIKRGYKNGRFDEANTLKYSNIGLRNVVELEDFKKRAEQGIEHIGTEIVAVMDLKTRINNMLNEVKSVEIKVNNLFSIKKDVPIDYVDGYPPTEDDAYYRMVFSGIPYIANPHYETLASRDYDEIMAEITLFITDTMDSIRDSLIENMEE